MNKKSIVFLGCLVLIAFLASSAGIAEAKSYVRGYSRGKSYVRPHIRYKADGYRFNNYQYRPDRGYHR